MRRVPDGKTGDGGSRALRSGRGRSLAWTVAAAVALALAAADASAAELGRDELTRLVAGSSGTDLSGANLRKADINGARFKGIKGREEIIGLDTAKNLRAARFD